MRRALRNEAFSKSELAVSFGVARKTIYQRIERYEESSLEALADQSRRHSIQAGRTVPEIEGRSGQFAASLGVGWFRRGGV